MVISQVAQERVFKDATTILPIILPVFRNAHKKGFSFNFMKATALSLAKKWGWEKQKAQLLIEDLKMYNLCKEPFAGAIVNGIEWWEALPVKGKHHPLKPLTIIILSIPIQIFATRH